MIPLSSSELESLNERFERSSTDQILEWAWLTLGPRAAIGTSFQGAGLVMMHIAKLRNFPFPVFTIDTGLLFSETLALKQRLEDFFGTPIESLVPDLTVEQQAEAVGPELWKRDPDQCCTLRKVLPLQAKLGELDCWVTGLRRQQSQSRTQVKVLEAYVYDESTGREILKLNPMVHWPREDIWKYIKDHKIPYNPLHDRGYHSIGCEPCTSLSGEGDDERAGRWVGFQKVECGIHTFLKARTATNS